MKIRAISCVLALLLAATVPVIAAAQPTQRGARVSLVKPEALKAAISPKGYTILLITSPDPKCTYCVGQSQFFDKFAVTYQGNAKLLDVQWAPWRPFPQDDYFPRPVGYIPVWQAFKDGEFIGQKDGRITDQSVLATFVDDATNDRLPTPKPYKPPTKTADPSPQPNQVSAPALTPQEAQALASMVRRDLAQAALQRCSKALPGASAQFNQALATYEQRHKADIEWGTRLLITRTGKSAAQEMNPIVSQQMKRLQAQAPMKSVTLESCGQLADAVAKD